MSRISLLAALASLSVLLPVTGETLTLDVDTAVQLALENNLQIRSEQIDLNTATRSKEVAWNEYLPQINTSINLSRSNEIIGLDPSPWNLGFSVEASLALSAATQYAVREAGLAYESGLIDFQTAKIQVERDVRKAFFSLIVAEQSIQLAEQELVTAQKRYQQTLQNFEAGLVPRLQALSAQVAMENLKPALERQRIGYTTALMNLAFMLGLDSKDEIELQGSIEAEAHSFDAGRLIQRYVNNRLDVQSLLKQIEILENTKRLSRITGFSPTVSLSYSYAPGLNDPFGSGWSNDDSWSDSGRLVLAVMMPLHAFIPGSQFREGLAELDDGIEKLHLALEQVREAAAIEIESIVLELEKSQRSMTAFDLNVELAREAYDLTEEAYRAGTEELLEVQNASDELNKAQLALLNEKYTYLSGLLDLEYALNTKLSELEENNE